MVPPLWLLSAGGFFKKHWKIIVIVLAVIAAVLLFRGWINGIKKEAYDNGVRIERTHWENEVKKENKRNRDYERQLTQDVLDFGKQFAKGEADRITKESSHTNTIREIVEKDPNSVNCKVPAQVITERNSIRRLGPNPGV